MSQRRAWTVQVTFSSSQRARARSTSKPAGVPSGSVKAKGGSSCPVTMSRGFSAAGSGFGGGEAGSHRFGTKTSGGGAARAGTAAQKADRISAGRRRDAAKAGPWRGGGDGPPRSTTGPEAPSGPVAVPLGDDLAHGNARS